MTTTPTTVPSAYDRARELLASGDHAAARSVLEAHLGVEPGDVAAWVALAICGESAGDPALAERALRQAVALAPDAAPVRFRLIRLLERQGRRDAAAAVLPPAEPVRPAVHEPSPAPAAADRPLSLAADLDARDEADPGAQLLATNRLLRSYPRSWVAVAALLAAGAGAVASAGSVAAPAGLAPADVAAVTRAAGAAALAVAAALLGGILVRAATTRYVVYERRVDVARGLLNRRRFSVWYYDVTDVSYRRPLLMLLTGTAILELRVDDLDRSRSSVSLPGLGSARRVREMYERLQRTALRERRAMKKQFV